MKHTVEVWRYEPLRGKWKLIAMRSYDESRDVLTIAPPMTFASGSESEEEVFLLSTIWWSAWAQGRISCQPFSSKPPTCWWEGCVITHKEEGRKDLKCVCDFITWSSTLQMVSRKYTDICQKLSKVAIYITEPQSKNVGTMMTICLRSFNSPYISLPITDDHQDNLDPAGCDRSEDAGGARRMTGPVDPPQAWLSGEAKTRHLIGWSASHGSMRSK